MKEKEISIYKLNLNLRKEGGREEGNRKKSNAKNRKGSKGSKLNQGEENNFKIFQNSSRSQTSIKSSFNTPSI